MTPRKSDPILDNIIFTSTKATPKRTWIYGAVNYDLLSLVEKQNKTKENKIIILIGIIIILPILVFYIYKDFVESDGKILIAIIIGILILSLLLLVDRISKYIYS